MANKIDKEFQLKLLREMAEKYPSEVSYSGIYVPPKTMANLAYLQAHNLIDLEPAVEDDGQPSVHSTKITAKGLDYISDDGGLTAELGVVTVKLHEDTIKELMIAKIQSSDANSTVKKNLIETLKKLPADAMKELSMAAVRRGIDSLPDAVQWFQTLFQHSS